MKTRLGNHDRVFRRYPSNEGMRFSVGRETKLKKLEIWRGYFYLDYDVEPTCAERDCEEIKP